MPGSCRNNQAVARLQRHVFKIFIFEKHIDPARDQYQNLVATGMHLAAVWRIFGHQGQSDSQTFECRRRAGVVIDDAGLPLTG